MRSVDVPLQQRVASRLDQLVPVGATCLVAVSGGPDSIALLDLLHLSATQHGRPLIVAHVDHGIHPESGRVAGRVHAAAESRGLRFVQEQLSMPAKTSETRARAARRDALSRMAAQTGAGSIVLAHHADDQAETVLLRLLRGSGPAGLAGMAARHGKYVRPLLGLRRSELAEHLRSRGLEAWLDPANLDIRHLRSWLRTKVVPAFVLQLPDVVERVNLAAMQAADARRGWAEVLDQLAGLEVQRSHRGISVAAPVLQGYRSPLRHAVLAALGRQVGVLAGARRLRAIDSLLAAPLPGGVIDLSAEVQVELAFGRLAFQRTDRSTGVGVILKPGSSFHVGDATFSVSGVSATEQARDGWAAVLVPSGYVARTWRAGDRIRPLGGSGSRAVAVMLREARVAPSRRKFWPVVSTDDDATIVWVPGICRSDAAVPAQGTEAWRVECDFT